MLLIKRVIKSKVYLSSAVNVRGISVSAKVLNETKSQADDENLDEQIYKTYKDKVIFNSVLENLKSTLGYKVDAVEYNKRKHEKRILKEKISATQPLPISLKYLNENITSDKTDNTIDETDIEEKITHFPLQKADEILLNSIATETLRSRVPKKPDRNRAKILRDEIQNRYELNKKVNNWMTEYDNYDDKVIEVEEIEDDSWKVNYGTPDPHSRVSNIPCGGCGALLHCKDTSIPGYLPSEIYKNYRSDGGTSLQALICQRCHFLKNYNIALQMRVSEEDYPKILTAIHDKRALAVVMVDLMDFPCSIWPGIADILGPKTPIVIVGNKVDLIPKDSPKYLSNIKRNLLEHVKLNGFGTSNVRHVELISAKTGYGIEQLITELQSIWKYQGDVYLMGCTNVGKSSLFNALLQSDYCKIQSVDLIQRATTSLWPGTTLNLLKFPITRPSGYRAFLRHKRLLSLRRSTAPERVARSESLRVTKQPEFATLMGRVEHSYDMSRDREEQLDAFAVYSNANATGRERLGINERHPEYAMSRWCFDTPGVVQSDQILHLLTTDELMLAIPKQIIRPETFCIKAGTSLFIAGLGRLDYVEGKASVRLTVFRSNELPVTICKLDEADERYSELLQSNLLKVPMNDKSRLEQWPGLTLAKTFSVKGEDWNVSIKDVVLSSAGWIAINCSPYAEHQFQAWTPEKRGCYIRNCLLPHAVTLRGARNKFSPTYKPHKFV